MFKSKRYKANLLKVEAATKKSAILPVDQAVTLLQSLEQPKFKEGTTIEIHFKLNINPTKSDQLIRSTVTLPHGTGKKIKIAAFVSAENEKAAKEAGAMFVGGEELIDEIKKTEKVNFDIAVAEPEMMKLLPSIARILGVAGVMPNPKTGTVGDDVAKLIEPLVKGKINFKNDKTGNVHLICGKINDDFNTEKLVENIKAAIEAVEKSKPEVIKKKFIESAHIASTMSPSIRII
jgi:large subunit ribosomal protein L1